MSSDKPTPTPYPAADIEAYLRDKAATSAAHDWLREYSGSIDSVALILAFKAGRASVERESASLREELTLSEKIREAVSTALGDSFSREIALREELEGARKALANLAQAEYVLRGIMAIIGPPLNDTLEQTFMELRDAGNEARVFLLQASVLSPAQPKKEADRG